MSIRVATWNSYVFNSRPLAGAQALAAAGAQVIGVQEARRHGLAFGKLRGWRVCVTGEGRMREQVVLAGPGVRVLASQTEQVTKAIRGDKLAPARAIQTVVVEVDGDPWTVMNTHLNAGVQRTKGRWIGGFLRARRWKAHMRRIRAAILAMDSSTRRSLIILGDFNTLKDVPGYWQLERFFGALGFVVIRNGVDVVIVHRTRTVTNRQLISREVTGSDDHAAIVVTVS